MLPDPPRLSFQIHREGPSGGGEKVGGVEGDRLDSFSPPGLYLGDCLYSWGGDLTAEDRLDFKSPISWSLRVYSYQF